MNEYQKIADELQVRSNAVHLVHFVLNNMKVSCIFPPSPAQERAEFYTPENICVAIKAYLLAKYPDNPWETLNDFGIPSSRGIGRIVAALQDCDETKVVKNLCIAILFELVESGSSKVTPKDQSLLRGKSD